MMRPSIKKFLTENQKFAAKFLKGDLPQEIKPMGYYTDYANGLRLLMMWPEFSELCGRLNFAVFGRKSALPGPVKELIAAVVSKENRCLEDFSYHSKLMAKDGCGRDAAEMIREDFRYADCFDEKTLRLLEYTEKVAGGSDEVSEDDVRKLAEAGWGDREIIEMTAVAALVSCDNRLTNALKYGIASLYQKLHGKSKNPPQNLTHHETEEKGENKMQEQYQRIGNAAGKIYIELEKHGSQNMKVLKAASGVSDASLFQQALGWLAREDKIDFHKEGRGLKISLARVNV